jgi:hypothetical protein
MTTSATGQAWCSAAAHVVPRGKLPAPPVPLRNDREKPGWPDA